MRACGRRRDGTGRDGTRTRTWLRSRWGKGGRCPGPAPAPAAGGPGRAGRGGGGSAARRSARTCCRAGEPGLSLFPPCPGPRGSCTSPRGSPAGPSLRRSRARAPGSGLPAARGWVGPAVPVRPPRVGVCGEPAPRGRCPRQQQVVGAAVAEGSWWRLCREPRAGVLGGLAGRWSWRGRWGCTPLGAACAAASLAPPALSPPPKAGRWYHRLCSCESHPSVPSRVPFPGL